MFFREGKIVAMTGCTRSIPIFVCTGIERALMRADARKRFCAMLDIVLLSLVEMATS